MPKNEDKYFVNQQRIIKCCSKSCEECEVSSKNKMRKKVFNKKRSNRVNKILVALVVLVFILETGLVSALTPVCTNSDLNNVRNNLAEDYIQVCDINLEGYNLDPIGSSTSPFVGTFDGNGHIISNYFIFSTLSDVGFFGVIDKSSVLKNIILKNIKISADYNLGGLVGTMNNGTILNSSVYGEVNNTRHNGGGLIGIMLNGTVINSKFSGKVISIRRTVGSGNGGLIGFMGGNSKVFNSSVNAEIERSGSRIGGFVGTIVDNSFISNSYVIGNVTAIKSDFGGGFSIGGFVGVMSRNASIENSYANSNVAGSYGLGGFVGVMSGNSSIKNSYSTGDFINQSFGSGGDFGGFVGSIGGSAYINNSFSNITNVFTNGSNVGGFAASSVSSDYSRGVLIENSYSKTNVENVPLPLAGSGVVSAGGFIATILGKIRIYNSYSLGNVTANYSAGGFVGIIMAQHDVDPKTNVIIENSYSKGNVIGETKVGGFVGYATVATTINNSHSYGNVKGNDSVGGFVGRAGASDLPSFYNLRLFISQSSSKGNVYGNFSTGGFVGKLYGYSNVTIINSYSQSNVTVYNKDGGGFVGIFIGISSDPAVLPISKIVSTYSAGNFVNLTNNHMGGFAGYKENLEHETIFYSYWDKNKSTTLLSCGNDNPQICGSSTFPRTTEEMKKRETFVNWDFVNIWYIIEGQSYPFFKGSIECNTGADGVLGDRCNGCVSKNELDAYIQRYYKNEINIIDVSVAIEEYIRNPNCGG